MEMAQANSPDNSGYFSQEELLKQIKPKAGCTFNITVKKKSTDLFFFNTAFFCCNITVSYPLALRALHSNHAHRKALLKQLEVAQ